jgi:hypothetical protein
MWNTLQRTCVYGLLIFGLAGAAAAQTSSASDVTPTFRTSGMVGLAAGQIARLNVLNPGTEGPIIAGANCAAQLSFVNAAGVVVKTAPVNVMPGQSTPFDLYRDVDLASVAGLRVEIRATIQAPGAMPTAASTSTAATCRLIPTLEVFDEATGRTQFIDTRFHRNPPPTPTATTTP